VSNNKRKRDIKNHYDVLSPYYQKLWGNHIHHGYYVTGKESTEEATENLIRLLVEKSGIRKNSLVLDIGCGIGGTSIWLAKNYNCRVTGITVSSVQVKIAEELASKMVGPKPKFLLCDAEDFPETSKYDILWSVEVLSHLERRKMFFEKCSRILKNKGRFVIVDWFKDDNLTTNELQKYIEPINKNLMVSLWSSRQYRNILEENGLKLRYHEDISNNVKKTWDVGLGIIRKRELWSLAIENGKDFVNFLNGFNLMKKAFNSGAFRYEAMVFEK
jgi:tocopherol O-methyltransferase